MKNIKFYLLLIALVSAAFLTGCYTEVAVREYPRHNPNYGYDDNYSYDDSTYNDSTYNDSTYGDNGYYDDNGTIINNYYGYPFHNRYYWNYYPSYSFSLGFYNPYYWDPWEWCYTPYTWNTWWWYPYPYSYGYYSPFYYGGYGYYGGYYSGYYGGYYHSGEFYKTRSRGSYTLRNNIGLRGGSRSVLSGERGRGGTALQKSNSNVRSRDLNGSRRTYTNRNNSSGRSSTIESRRERGSRPPAVNRSNSGSRSGNHSMRRSNGSRGSRQHYNSYYPGSRGSSHNSYQPPRRTYSPPQRTYSAPPQRTYSSPHSYSPPSRSYSPPQGSSSNRGGDARSSGGSSGRRR